MALMTEPATSGAVDLTQDGSLLKTVLAEGQGEEAGRGARVALRYSLFLSDEDGAEPFDSSAKRKDGILEFTLGRSKAIPALELVAQSMKVGEECKVRSAPAYAFGSRGLKRKGVPPNAPIFLNMEMVRFEGGEKKKPLADMTPAERFEQAKKAKENGNTFFKEQKYDKALQQYSHAIRYLSNVFYKPSSTLTDPAAKPVSKNVVMEGKTVPSQEIAEENDASGEKSEGDKGFEEARVHEGEQSASTAAEGDTQVIPAPEAETKDQDAIGGDAAQVTTEIVNTTNESKQTNGAEDAEEDDDITETIDISNVAKDSTVDTSEANGGDVASGAAEPSQPETTSPETTSPAEAEESDDPVEEEVRSLHVTTLNNLSLCFVKLEEYKRAKETAGIALKIDPGSSKAFYYRARAEIALGEWETAKQDLQAAAKIQPNNPGIRNEIIKLDRKMKQFEQREKKQAAAMFA